MCVLFPQSEYKRIDLFDEQYDDLKLVDLTIADHVSYYDLNQRLENYGQKQVKKGIKATRILGFIPSVNNGKFKKIFTQQGVYTYTKLLSEQIFISLNSADNKSIMYAPFQTIA